MSVGERVAFYRRRRGMSQRILADLVGRSEDWVSKVERGVREIRRVDVIGELARALRVEFGDLVGQPVLAEDEEENDGIPAVRDALMSPRRLSRTLFRRDDKVAGAELPTVESAERIVAMAWGSHQMGRLGRVTADLPSLISLAQAFEDADDGDGRRWSVSARVHHLAATTLSTLGESDLAWISAERAMYAADKSEDPLTLASAARAATHALLASGRFDDAVELGNAAGEWMRAMLADGDPAALSLLGMLRLRTAVAAARRQDRHAAGELIARAQRAADRLGADANHWQTGFGPTNVEVHRLSVLLDLGDVAYVADHGPSVNLSGLPVERRVAHLADVARALSHLAMDDAALGLLLEAEAMSPHLVHHSPSVRETVKSMYRRSSRGGRGGTSPVASLAERCRVLQE